MENLYLKIFLENLMKEFRIIPVLLLSGNGFVKTTKFKNPVYLGDSLNIVKIFNEKEADELVILDILATKKGNGPNFKKIAEIASECFMPLSYGGGVRNLDDVSKILYSGFEKVILNNNNTNYKLINEISSKFGSSSTVASIDVKKNIFGNYVLFTNNGKSKLSLSIKEHINNLEDSGVGEIVLQLIDRDGTMKGYDLNLIKKISTFIKVPLVIVGGASGFDDFRSAINCGASAVGAGSLFVFKGKHKAVLVNYPERAEIIKNFYERI